MVAYMVGLHGIRWLGLMMKRGNLNGNSHSTGSGSHNSFYHK